MQEEHERAAALAALHLQRLEQETQFQPYTWSPHNHQQPGKGCAHFMLGQQRQHEVAAWQSLQTCISMTQSLSPTSISGEALR